MRKQNSHYKLNCNLRFVIFCWSRNIPAHSSIG